ncbi:MAG: Glycosyl transferase, group 1 [Candidatus Woesebacteria bacterium GW2011_GWB1_38_5b]|uniref:Glycosyl transferase, group 1 n=1 Tax=Candidatus Woesebacteria bacterium GW2011_GWB1_38_5b TaxID=1618569 RepID=A0A0G0KFP6_9BACT|nr:MAG: Glycosyl transferase, group 1 [Candidatus Woesebacteria bacterium GW2011_GWB1_38_5b]
MKHPQVGGAEIIVFELVKRLVKDGHKATWFSRSFVGGSETDAIDGIHIVRKGNLVTMYLFAILYYWFLKKKPDIVIDMSNTIYWQSPLWAFKSKKIAYLNQFGQEVFDYEYNPVIAYLGKLIERVQYITYRHTDFLCYSESTKNELHELGKINIKNVGVFPLGIRHEGFKPGKKSKDPLFIGINRMVKMKRTGLSVEAMKYVVKKYPKAKLALVGFGYDKESIQEQIKRHNLDKNVYFQTIPFSKKGVEDEKIKLMQEAWALVFPSVKEGWGMTVTECAACGTPAVVTDVTGLRDSVVKDKTGIVVSSNPSSRELANALIKIIEDRPLRKKLSRNAIKWSKNFTWQKSYKEFKKLILN